jgi:hypothetical protein
MLRLAIALLLVVSPFAASAATCTWNIASGNWSAAANWSNCADAPGPSTRAPGANDIAVLVNGTANLDASPTVAEFELGSNGLLSVVGSTKTFDVTSKLRFAGGKATTILGSNQLLLYLHAGGTGSLLASTILENAVFFENSGALALGSASGVALTLVCCAEVRNMPGATITMAGGNSRLYLKSGPTLVNNAGATLAISGNTLIGRADATSNLSYVKNLGTMVVNGPGTLNMPMGNGTFQQYGDLTVNNATIVCSIAAANPDKCSYQDNNGGVTPTGSITRLNNATLDIGGTGNNYNFFNGSTITGNGTINIDMTAYGKLAPGALSGAPYGTLTINGKLMLRPSAVLDLDIAGSGAGSHDSVQVGGTLQAGDVSRPEGYGHLNLRLASGYNPALGASVPVMTYPSVLAGAAFNRIDANYALDFAARFDPTTLQVFPAPRVTIDNQSVQEGASGTKPMTFNVRLSQASAQTVTVDIRHSDGSAVNGLSPSGDYIYPGNTLLTFTPGQTLQTAVFSINGDAVVEGDEQFLVELQRTRVVNAAFGNGVQGIVNGTATILTDELPPGTRYVLVGKDQGAGFNNHIRRYTTGGTFVDTWPGITSGVVTGMCFAPSGELLATIYSDASPYLYSRLGASLQPAFGSGPFGAGNFPTNESCVYDRAGNVYVGSAGINGSADSSVPIRKFDKDGNLLDTFVVPTGTRGTDWIDLAGDQCTIYYTSEDTSVRRYNVCTKVALPVFANGLTGPYCYALRLRPNREVMVACQDAVHRLSPQGANLHTYTRASIGEADPNGLFAMNLDPDGTSFWTAGAVSGNVYHVDIETGTPLGSFNSGGGGVGGLAIYDELHDDTIFLDGFEGPPVLAPIVFGASLTADAEEETEFDADVGALMPPFVPNWMRVIAHERFERERGR